MPNCNVPKDIKRYHLFKNKNPLDQVHFDNEYQIYKYVVITQKYKETNSFIFPLNKT